MGTDDRELAEGQLMQLVTICLVYAGDSNHPFITGKCVAVTSHEEIRAAAEELAKPLIADGFRIVNQLFVIAPDEEIAKLVGSQSTQ